MRPAGPGGAREGPRAPYARSQYDQNPNNNNPNNPNNQLLIHHHQQHRPPKRAYTGLFSVNSSDLLGCGLSGLGQSGIAVGDPDRDGTRGEVEQRGGGEARSGQGGRPQHPHPGPAQLAAGNGEYGGGSQQQQMKESDTMSEEGDTGTCPCTSPACTRVSLLGWLLSITL